MGGAPLRLMARDAEDLQVVSAILQDAIAPLCDMTYRATEQRFVLIVQRFLWDEALGRDPENGGLQAAKCGPCPDGTSGPCYERTSCAVDILGVEAAQFMGIDTNNAGAMLDLLTLSLEPPYLHLIFAGGGRLRLKIGPWSLKLHDFGEAWPTPHCPRHTT